MKRFFDSNIFVYAYSRDPKAEIAQNEIAKGGYISTQVLNEVANVMRKKMGQSWEEITDRLFGIEQMAEGILPLTLATHKHAVMLSRDHGLNIYDGLIIASALETACDALLTEDLQHGRRFGHLVIRNPFLPEGY